MENVTEAILTLNDTLKTPLPFNWSDWSLVVITLAYVIATIFICYFNYRSAKATRDQVQEQKRQFDEVNRPNVDVSCKNVRGGLECLKIENTGKKLAKNIKLKINEDFLQSIQGVLGNKNLTGLNASIFSLGIGQELFVALCGPRDYGKLCAVPLRVDISYEDDRQVYTGHATIDFSQYEWTLIYESPLGDISEHQKKISETLSQIDKLLQRG